VSDFDGLMGLFGSAEHIAVERALAEFRSGRPVLVANQGRLALAMPVDGMDDVRLKSFRQLCAPAIARLVITSQRARALGLDAIKTVALELDEANDAATIVELASDAGDGRSLTPLPVSRAADAAIDLAKLAHRLPALLVADAPPAGEIGFPLVTVQADAITKFRQQAIDSLAVAAQANVPLSGGIQGRFVVFRDAVGGSSVAVIVGRPDFKEPMPVRLHSACLTGDVFGSRRCDCGDQLRLALTRLDEQGGGIIIYLEQEGRGLGLANKMRTYQLQDAGLDTIDANAALGFDDDERDYGVAARMLQILGCRQVRLLTNNPTKLDGLVQAGIEVVGRIPLHGPVNPDNRRYLTAKAERAGHKLDYLLTAYPEAADQPDEQVGPPVTR
jgi:GTP cyclohydrolase II